jgi:hypothetical protein
VVAIIGILAAIAVPNRIMRRCFGIVDATHVLFTSLKQKFQQNFDSPLSTTILSMN